MELDLREKVLAKAFCKERVFWPKMCTVYWVSHHDLFMFGPFKAPFFSLALKKSPKNTFRQVILAMIAVTHDIVSYILK